MATQTFELLSAEISQAELATFADEKVNLKREHAEKYREQVANLRNHLDRYVFQSIQRSVWLKCCSQVAWPKGRRSRQSTT